MGVRSLVSSEEGSEERRSSATYGLAFLSGEIWIWFLDSNRDHIVRSKENRFNKRSTQGGEEKRKDLLEFRNPNPIRFRLVRTIFVLLASPSEPIK